MTDNIAQLSRRERRHAARTSRAGTIADNAGAAGRTAAVALAASGLVITGGVAANATESEEGRELTTVALNSAELNVERASSARPAAVSASQEVELTFDRPVVSSTAAPEPEPAPEPVIEAAPVSQTTETQPAPAEQPAQSQPAEQPAQSQPAEQTQSQEATSSNEDTSAASSEPESAPAPSGGGNSSVVSAAYGYIGIPWSQMDCSATVQSAYAAAGISVPRTTYGQMGLPQVSSPQAGDIVIANGGQHAAIYIGNGQVISSTVSGGIRVHGLHESWHNVTSYHRPG